jgi:hypothetical protein
LSAIFAPGAIVAQLQTYTTTQSVPLNEVNFDTSVYFESHVLNRSHMGERSLYHSVIQEAMLERGNITPVIHTNKDCNVSYHSEFLGPSVTCKLADENTTNHVNREARASALQNGISLKILVTFIGFQNSSERRDYMPFPNPASGKASQMHLLFPHLDDDNATLYTCDFVNATYQVHFNLYSDTSQRIRAVTTALNSLHASASRILKPYGRRRSNGVYLYCILFIVTVALMVVFERNCHRLFEAKGTFIEFNPYRALTVMFLKVSSHNLTMLSYWDG